MVMLHVAARFRPGGPERASRSSVRRLAHISSSSPSRCRLGDGGQWNNKQQVGLLLLANGRAAAKIGFAMLARAREKTLKAKTNGIFHATCEKLFPVHTKNSLR